MPSRNYAVAPGAFLEEWIDDQRLSQQSVADRLGVSRKLVNEIVNGHAAVTSDTAIKLQRVTTIPVDTWLRYEALYRADLARIADEEHLGQYVDRIPSEAATYLRKLGATKATKARPEKLVGDFLTFHRCGTWAAYESHCASLMTGDYALAALKEAKSTLEPTLLTPWLRAGELTEEYERGRSFTFSPAALREAIPALRDRVAHPDPDTLNDVAAILRQVGVVFLVIEAPRKLPLRGMTAWIEKSVPVVQQTGRWKKDGHVVWALFHELGHILSDPRGESHLDTSAKTEKNTESEKRANDFAWQHLFPDAQFEKFQGLTRSHEIKSMAREVGVAPGLAVFLMHRKRWLDYQYGNTLMVDLGDTFSLM